MITAPRPKTMKSADMDLKPFMNLMVVLIPMLLLSADFERTRTLGSTQRNRAKSGYPDRQKHGV